MFLRGSLINQLSRKGKHLYSEPVSQYAIFGAASVAMLIAPLTYQWYNHSTSGDGWWQIDTPWEALVVSILAVFVVGPISLYVTNLLARISGVLAQAMLGRSASGQDATTAPAREHFGPVEPPAADADPSRITR